MHFKNASCHPKLYLLITESTWASGALSSVLGEALTQQSFVPGGTASTPRPGLCWIPGGPAARCGQGALHLPQWHGVRGHWWTCCNYLCLDGSPFAANGAALITLTSWGVWLLCAGNSSERKRKRLENQAQVGCQEDLRNRKTENEKEGSGDLWFQG